VLADEIIGMVKTLTRGLETSDETLPLRMIERLGPKSSFISEKHTLKHFRRFWAPTVFDRSFSWEPPAKGCEELLNEKTIKILQTHNPKPLPDDLVKELKKMEKTWFKQAGLKYEYPKRER